MALQPNKVIYSAGGEYGFQLQFEIRDGGLTPTIAHYDAAVTAFFDELENQHPFVAYATKAILGDDQISGNFWEAP